VVLCEVTPFILTAQEKEGVGDIQQQNMPITLLVCACTQLCQASVAGETLCLVEAAIHQKPRAAGQGQ
jgi:hypothetical protein